MTKSQTNTPSIPFIYIFSGKGEWDAKSGKIITVSESFDVVRHRVLFSEETVLTKTNAKYQKTTFKNNKQYRAWYTDIKGVLQQVSDEGFGAKPGRAAKVEPSRAFFMPPKSILGQTVNSQKEGWAKYFDAFFNKNPDVTFTEIPITGLTWEKFREPRTAPKTNEEKVYASWYQDIK